MPNRRVLASRPRGRQWVGALTAAGLGLAGLRYRARLAALPTVPRTPTGPGADDGDRGDAHDADDGLGRFVLVAVEGARFAPGAARDAVAHAEREGLDALDLVPADLDAERAIEMARLVDPAAFRAHRLAPGRGANQAVLVDRDLLARLELKVDGPVEEADVAEVFREAKHGAPLTTDLAVLPGLAAAPEHGGRRRSLLRTVYGDESAPAASLLGLAALGVGVAASPAWGLAALAAYCAEPAVALGGGPLGGGTSPGDALLRPARSAARAVRTLTGRASASRVEQYRQALDQARAEYRRLLASGTDRFLLPRRATCPWCGGAELTPRVDSPDLSQLKPGMFHVDGCTACGHLFSNPPLSAEGLDFYYRDFYSGPFQHGITTKFLMDEPLYRKRAELVRRHVGPEPPARWLDVGTGHGHFCLAAREQFPDTRFEAVDMGEAVVTAARRGWVDEAHPGLLPDLADGLAGRFDVVSMHHCLEHTQEPRRELAAMRTVLRPGGLLHIEVPDPECRSGRLLGRWWGPWFQPQHQTLIPIGNLCEALEADGFTIVATERREAHEQFDATLSTYLRLHTLGPPPDLPWRPARPGATARRAAVFALGAPALALAMVVDVLANPVVRRLPGGPNAYRVLARLDAPTPTDSFPTEP
jgi:SAM-dependent methyltransferase